MAMKVVGIRELKDRLSEYIRLVRRSGPVLVRNRGEIVAVLALDGRVRRNAEALGLVVRP
jgi:antitoxin (DNA-binding transcriptional repressor) of toxin-antitoxin stability system